MTEAEAFQSAIMASANTVTSFTVYITFTFGYLAAAYFAGRNLSSAQAVIVSGLYLFSSLSALLSVLSDLEYYQVAMSHAPSLVPAGMTNGAEFWLLYMGILLSAGIIASLYFMWSIHHEKDDT